MNSHIFRKIKESHKSNFKQKIKTSQLFIISVITILVIISIHLLTNYQKTESYNHMKTAAEKMITATKNIQKLRLDSNIPIDPIIDPNQSGFIGTEFSPITTTLGNLEAKQIAVNPDFTALLVRWITEINIKPESDIIIHASASFPALTIMAIIACETLDMHPVILSSLGASSYGANLSRFTYLDIEKHLIKKENINHQSSFVTPGGNNDNGSSLWEGGLKIIKNSAEKYNYNLFIPVTLEDAIEHKWKFIFKNAQPKLFINIGGNHTAFGNGNCALDIPTGKILSPLKCSDNNFGLIHKFSQYGIPVFHFLQIRDLAVKNGIGIIPSFSKKSGLADIYYKKSKPKVVILISIIILSMLIIMSSRIKNSYGDEDTTPSVSKTISTNRN